MAFLSVGLLTLASCADEMEFDNDTTIPVKELLTPTQGAQLWLINSPEANSLFEWGMVGKKATQRYYVTFYDRATGGEELMRFDNGMAKTEILISHDNLVNVAAKAGIRPSQSGDLYWNVIAYNGNRETQPTAARSKLTVTRYAAIEDVPMNLYLGGVADKENETSLRPFYNAGNGRFEIYAQINTGEELFLTNRGDGVTARRFFVTTADGITTLSEGDGASSNYNGTYRITADFNTSRAKVEQISGVSLFYCWDGNGPAMSYQGKGVWKAANYTIPTGDDRYRFKALIDGVEYIWGGSASLDSSPSSLEGSYYDLTFTKRGSMDQWGYKYKFMGDTKGKTTNVYLHMEGSRNYHAFDFGNVTPEAVTAIATPAALVGSTPDKAVDIADISAVPVVFGWTTTSTVYGLPAKYRVNFYLEKEGKQSLIRSIDAGTAKSLSLSGGEIDAMLSEAGIAAKKVGTIVWSVDTYILDKTATQQIGLGRFSVIRFQLPDNFYITGAATEGGATLASAKKMMLVGNTGSGTFQIYTHLAAGVYNFVTSIDNNRDTYTLENGKLTKGTAAITATEGIYRITANIATKSLTLEKIGAVQLRNESNGNWTKTLAYTSDGCWVTPSEMNISRIGNNGERYYFSAIVGAEEEIWGYSRSNNDPETYHWQEKDSHNNDLPPQYIYVRKRGTIDRWSYTFKDGRGSNFSTEHDFREAKLYMNGDQTVAHAYYHIRGVWGEYYSGDRTAVIDTHFVHIANN